MLTIELASQRLQAQFKKYKIAGIVTDWDDMMANTSELYRRVMDQYAFAVVQKAPSLNFSDFRKQLSETNIRFHSDPNVGVRPTRWTKVTHELSKLYALKTRKVITDPQHVDIFASIYTTAPRLFPYVLPTLQIIHRTQIPFFVLTHSGNDWANLKVGKTRRYFTDVMTVDINQPEKMAADWKRPIRKGNIDPDQAMAMGDSKNNDIIPASEAGFRFLIWKPGHWDKHFQSNEIPEQTMKIKNIRRLIPMLLDDNLASSPEKN